MSLIYEHAKEVAKMSNTINPYKNGQNSISLKLKQLIDTTIGFKFQFFMDDIGHTNEPMYEWLVDTKKLAGGLKDDEDRSLIKHQRREKSWIGYDYGYWSGVTRYFVIGYAIEQCKTNSANLAVDLERLVELFTDRDYHEALIKRFVDDFFYDSSIDIHSTRLCRKRSVPEYRILKACFINGYRLCADLYLALDQAKNIGPVNHYIELLRICEALGFDEIPLWYIQESSNHRLNHQIKKDVEAQKHLAAWAFVSNSDQSLLISKNDPYGVEGSIPSQTTNSFYAPSAPKSRIKPKRTAIKKPKQTEPKPVIKNNSQEGEVQPSASSLEALMTNYTDDSETKPEVDSQAISSIIEPDIEIEVEVEADDDESEQDVPVVSDEALSLLNQFST